VGGAVFFQSEQVILREAISMHNDILPEPTMISAVRPLGMNIHDYHTPHAFVELPENDKPLYR
jgi:hypothetical protein